MAQFPGIAWDQRPDYLALTQRVDPAGIVTAYNPPRPGVSATDVTSFVYGQATITRDSWPEVMYYLNPTPEWTAFRGTPKPPQKVDANGQPMFERFPRQGQQARPLLDFPILPDTICSREELWWIILWRRMDPRIHWEDIVMRIERPTRTVASDRQLANSTNNLINRHEHRRDSMLSWHSTGTNSMRPNNVRTLVLRRVNAARPPLPPNSTRGLTPGLTDPALGNVPGNVVPQPEITANQGRLRVGLGNRRVTQVPGVAIQAATNVAQANPQQQNQPQTPASRNNQGRNNQGQKRRCSSREHKGRAKKRRAADDEDTEDDDMETRSGGSESSEEIPLTVARVRAEAETKKTTKPASKKKPAVKAKTNPKTTTKAKKSRQSAVSQQRHSSTEPDANDNSEDDKAETPSAGHIFLEDEPGFNEAFDRQQQERRQPSNRTTAPQIPASPAQPPNTTPTPTPRQNISAITGLPFVGPHRRPEAMHTYDASQTRRRSSAAERARLATSSSVNVPLDITGRPIPRLVDTGPPPPARAGPNDFHVYTRAPDGTHHHFTDNSGRVAFERFPGGPPTGTRVGFTATQRAEIQARNDNAQPPTEGENAPPNPQARETRLNEENTRHNDALLAEINRRHVWPRQELARHTRAVWDIMREDGDDYATGFLEREEERERREHQPPDEDDDAF